jgi:hypothetical protein
VYFGGGSLSSGVFKVSLSGSAPVQIATYLFAFDIAGSDAHFIYAFQGWGSNIPVYRYVK